MLAAALAAVLAFAEVPVCDLAGHLTRRPGHAPPGALWDAEAGECRQADGYNVWSGSELWVFRGLPCGLSDYRGRLSRTVGHRVELEGWVLTPDAWRGRAWVVSCGDAP